jgi:hypothetical protein
MRTVRVCERGLRGIFASLHVVSPTRTRMLSSLHFYYQMDISCDKRAWRWEVRGMLPNDHIIIRVGTAGIRIYTLYIRVYTGIYGVYGGLGQGQGVCVYTQGNEVSEG